MVTEARVSIGVVMIAVCVTLCNTYEIKCHPHESFSQRPYPDLHDVGNCSAGTYWEGFRCSPCEHGTFRTQQMALENKLSPCQKCTEPGQNAVQVEPCNAAADTKITCEGGHFRYQNSENPCTFECKRCEVCGTGQLMYTDYETKSCSDESNTICCEREGMDVVDGKCVAKEQLTEPTTATIHSVTITTEELSTFTNISMKAPAMRKEGSSTKSGAGIIFQKPYLLSLTVTYFVTADYIKNFKL